MEANRAANEIGIGSTSAMADAIRAEDAGPASACVEIGPTSAIRAVIFDMDGVLVDSEPIYFEIEQASFSYYGIHMVEEEQHQFVGITPEEMWRQVKSRYALSPSVAELAAFHQSNVLKAIERHPKLTPMPQAAAFLHRLKQRGIPVAVASSSPMALIELMLTRIGLREKFDAIASGEEVRQGKPAPDIFLLAAARLGFESNACLVVEDSSNGVKAAKAAGMACAGFRNPHSGNQDLSLADWIVEEYGRFATDIYKSKGAG
ncbi:HAD family hydrolase [Paenibacillus methanolicus]|uniref:HAD superfamily hydrolase (TIGR01509 family) n=1 Tax=Paenibacillus methanolicus TaxID=582686 RepID=A0A5S5CBL8_9BACL|nr:HAD family phosphatase [Paenibacillus methanolicus]TYP76765.1 HAD superfamily hydrolase (TIGR01509 family) [Paenibacillus methanolicus]